MSALECSSDVLFQEVNDELVLLDLKSESYFGLNLTGARIWTLLKSGHSEEAIIQQLQHECDVDQQTLTQDVQDLIAQLLEAGLLKQI